MVLAGHGRHATGTTGVFVPGLIRNQGPGRYRPYGTSHAFLEQVGRHSIVVRKLLNQAKNNNLSTLVTVIVRHESNRFQES